jgi:hypothetical protein
MVAWNTIDFLRAKTSLGPAETVGSVHHMKYGKPSPIFLLLQRFFSILTHMWSICRSSGPSGGTLATILSYMEEGKLSDFAKLTDPFILCAGPTPRNPYRKPLTEMLSGVRSVSDLGALTHLQVAWLTCPLSTEAAPSCQVHTVRLSHTLITHV